MNQGESVRDGLVAIVPAYNEQDRVDATIRHIRRVGCDVIIVVDDGSRDHTAQKAKEAGASVITFDENRGKGAALAAGIRAAPHDASVFLLVDADLQSSAARLKPLVDAVDQGADIAIAGFSTGGGFGLAKRLASRGIQLLTGHLFDSPLSGQRALTKRASSLFGMLPEGWGIEVGMTVAALRQGLHVVEIPIPLTHRESGRDVAGFVHRGKQCAAVVRTLCQLGMQRSHHLKHKRPGSSA